MKRTIALILAVVLMLCLAACGSEDKSKTKYDKAMSDYNAGNYQAARSSFEALGKYKDSQEMIQACDYAQASAWMDDEKYEKAAELFVTLGEYEDSQDKNKACNYALAKELMADEEYAKAAQLFETLGDYEDSAEKMQKCRTNEIDALLQGSWEATESVITFNYRFDNGRFVAKLTVSGSSVSNEGSYRVDVENQEIYVCYDYIFDSSGIKTPNTAEQKLFTYTYDGETFALSNTTGQTVVKLS